MFAEQADSMYKDLVKNQKDIKEMHERLQDVDKRLVDMDNRLSSMATKEYMDLKIQPLATTTQLEQAKFSTILTLGGILSVVIGLVGLANAYVTWISKVPQPSTTPAYYVTAPASSPYGVTPPVPTSPSQFKK